MTTMGRKQTFEPSENFSVLHTAFCVPYWRMNHRLPPSPAGRRIRTDGWTHDRRVTFCVALAASGSVTFAAASAGLSRKSAYALRKRDRGFASLWDRSLAAARAARREARRRAFEGNEKQARPEPCRPINFINRRQADAADRDRFFAALESRPPVPVP